MIFDGCLVVKDQWVEVKVATDKLDAKGNIATIQEREDSLKYFRDTQRR